MITKKRFLTITLCLVLFTIIPFIGIIAGQPTWLVSIMVGIGLIGIFSTTFYYKNSIVSAYKKITSVIKNRIWGYRPPKDVILPLISAEQQSKLDNALKFTFTGDLILLREMVERALNPSTGEHEFDSMFQHVSDIWKDADLSIGVFEGPLGGNEIEYSNSNFDDRVPLALNFPDSFAKAVKKAGINLVSLANNHIFDVGIQAGVRTPDVLNKIGLRNVGFNSYNDRSKEKPFIIEVEGKRIGVLAYTFLNGKTDSFFFKGPYKDYVKPVVKVSSKYFKQNVELIKQDFEKLKAENPDMIIVLPHMGEQFRGTPDKSQRKWCEIFIDLGADIVFADHPHHVQPIEWRTNKSGKRVLVVYCPGNYVNSYVQDNGDASMIVTVFLSRDTLDPFAVGVTPIYAHCPQNGMWTGLPTYKAITDKQIYNSLSRADFRRINEVNRLVTKIALGGAVDVDLAQKRYIKLADDGMVHCQIPSKNFSCDLSNSTLGCMINKANKICFVGDSLTEGTKNGGQGWFEPLLPLFPNKQITSYAKGLQGSKWLLKNVKQIADKKADLYIIALGCNDIRYREPAICAMTYSEYITNIDTTVNIIRAQNPNAEFVFIAPWRSLSFDFLFIVKSFEARLKLYEDYTRALTEYCASNNFVFLDPSPLIFENLAHPQMRVKKGNDIMIDAIHPRAGVGVETYCQAVMQCETIN